MVKQSYVLICFFVEKYVEKFLYLIPYYPLHFSLFVLEWFYRICIYPHMPRTYPLCKNMPAVLL